MALTASYTSNLTVTDQLDSSNNPFAKSGADTVIHDGLNKSITLPSTSPAIPCTQVAFAAKALSSGSGTIDLTNLVGTNGEAVDLTGLKIQAIKFRNRGTNANNITITEGASNGYALLGASFSVTLAPGQEITIYGNDATPDVASGDKTIDLVGTGSQVLEFILVAG